jgi:hypothetical protein
MLGDRQFEDIMWTHAAALLTLELDGYAVSACAWVPGGIGA